jgi:hypothetical protein
MKIKSQISILILLFLVMLIGCQPNPNDAFIQGTWIYNSEHLQNLAGEQHLTVVWSFDRGAFSYSACCFNIDTFQTGSYGILESEGDRLLLELFNVKGGSPGVGGEILVKINRGNGTLSIGGTAPYERDVH